MVGAPLLIWVGCLLVAARAPLVWPLGTSPDDKHTLLDNKYPQMALHISPPTSNELLKSDDDPGIWPRYLERTAAIAVGDLCVDVRDRRYENGNPVQLYPCRFEDNVNQLWTFNRDGTIRSNGKCLGSYGHTPGDYIMIYDCDAASDDKFNWKVWINGTIISKTGLVLTANSLESGKTLTAEIDTYARGQIWFLDFYLSKEV